MSLYQVEFLGRENPCRDLDALGVRLRTRRDDDYFQFFVGLVPGQLAVALGPKPGDDWWRAFALCAAEEIERVVRAGFVPMSEPTLAARLLVEVREARPTSAAARPEFDPTEQYAVGPVIHTFTA